MRVKQRAESEKKINNIRYDRRRLETFRVRTVVDVYLRRIIIIDSVTSCLPAAARRRHTRGVPKYIVSCSFRNRSNILATTNRFLDHCPIVHVIKMINRRDIERGVINATFIRQVRAVHNVRINRIRNRTLAAQRECLRTTTERKLTTGCRSLSSLSSRIKRVAESQSL